jgi:hypothetical protein
MVNKIVTALVMSGVIASFGTASQESLQAAGYDELRDVQEQKSIVGSWMGTLDNGERLLMSFTSDGIVHSSVQAEVKLNGPVVTPGLGAWERVGRRRFAITEMAILYDIQTGEYQGAGKVRLLLTLDKAGNLSGDAKVDVFDPDGHLIVTFPHTIRLTRITVEPLD